MSNGDHIMKLFRKKLFKSGSIKCHGVGYRHGVGYLGVSIRGEERSLTAGTTVEMY